MAIIQDFAFIGVKNLLVKDKKTKEVVAELPYLVGFNLSDNQPIEYLRGGFERLKLLPFKGDRETSVTVTTATSCPDLLKLQLNTEFEDAEQIFDQVVNLNVVDGAATIPAENPVAEGTVMTVFAVDAMGKKSKLAAGEAVAEGVYVYADGVITVGEGVNSVRVMYQTKKNAQVLKAKDVDTKTYEATGIVVAQEVGTGEMYDVQVDIPAAVFQLNNQLDASNEGGVPDNVEFTIDMLADATKDYVYQLSFAERA